MEKREFYSVGGTVNWYCHRATVEDNMKVPLKPKIELPYDLAVSLLGMYPEKNIVQNDICTPMFLATLFIIAKMGNQPKCPSIEEWMQKTWYTQTKEHHSVIKKKEIMPLVATWVDLENMVLSKV